jgi:hypothetical protein
METLYDVYWEGPFTLDNISETQENHVLYMICGFHLLYGQNIPLYIGKTERAILQRIKEHEKSWLYRQTTTVQIYVASIGEFSSWNNRNNMSEYIKSTSDIISKVEQLLIYAHQPVFNSSSKNKIDSDIAELRLFNTGKRHCLLPEISSLFQVGQ